MLKRITALFLCAFLIFPLCLFNVYAAESFYDDFSTIRVGGRLDGTKWQLTNKDYMTIAVDPTGTRNALKMEAENAGDGADTRFQTAAANLYEGFNSTLTVEESFFFPKKIDESAQFYTLLYTNECTTSNTATQQPFFYLRDGNITTAGGIILPVSYPVGKWFTLKIVIYPDDFTFDIMIETEDGTITSWGEMLPIPEGWANLYKEWGLRRIRTGFIFSGGSDVAYVGGVSIYKGIPKNMGGSGSVSFPEGTENSEYKNGIQLLSLLGVINETSVNPDEVVTRAEAAKYALRLGGASPLKSYNAPFIDVEEDSPHSGYIAAAENMGVVNSGELFYPNEPVTGYQMLTMLLNCAGYKLIAQSRGVWPGGYVRVANEYDMLSGISFSMSDPLTLGRMSQLAVGFLKVYFAEEYLEKNSLSVSYGKNNSIAYAVFGMNSAQGIVEAVSSKAIYGYSTDEGKVKIGGFDFSSNYSGIENYFGQYVEYWYDDDGLVYYAYPYAKRNTVTRIRSKYFSLDSSGNINYEDLDEKVRSVYVAADAAILYNGIRLDNFSADDIEGADELELISNDNDSTYEIVNIIKTDVLITAGFSAKEKVFYDRSGDVRIDLEDKESVRVFKNGESVRLSALKEGTVVSVATEKLPYGSVLDAAQYITFYISDEKVSGKVTGIGEGEIQIDEETYLVSSRDPEIELGDWGVFRLDYLGRIAYFVSESEAGGSYGIILESALNTKRFTEYAEFKILKTDEEEEVFKTGEEVFLNNEKVTAAEAVSYLGSYVMNDVIRYDMDMYGKLYSIQTATDYSAEIPYIPYHPEEFSMDFNGRPKLHDDHETILTQSINSDSSTTVFIKYHDEGEIKFAIIPGDTIELIATDEGKSYHRPQNVKVYNTNASGIAGIAFITSDQIVTSMEATVKKSVPLIITKISTDNNDDVVITGIQGKAYVTLKCDADKAKILTETSWKNNLTYDRRKINTINDLKKGDIIQYHYNLKGDISTIHVLYNSSIPYSEYQTNYPVLPDDNQYRSTSTHTGEVLLKRDGFITLSSSPGRSFCLPASAPVSIIRQNGKIVEIGTVDDISTGDCVMIFARYLNIKSIFVFKS